MAVSRRSFLKNTGVAGAAAAFPTIISSSLIIGCQHAGAGRRIAPNEKIQIGIIGCGRISTSFEVPGIMNFPNEARIVALCDLDSRRLAHAKARVERDYNRKLKINNYRVKTYSWYRDLIANPEIDAVMVCVPDHWHALCAAEVLLAGKHLWLQKPFSQTIQEGRIVANLARMKNAVVQVGSQQRSWSQFHDCCELVRNGRIGEIKRIEVGIGIDREGGSGKEMPIPENLDYNTWLGPTPLAPYNETRVHTQNLAKITNRPGWIQLAPYGWGMITNWGAHHMDICQWGLGTEDSGPDSVSGTCEWMSTEGGKLWNVHTSYDLHYMYGKTDVHVCNKYQNGVKFIGEKGQWLFCTRGAVRVTASDPIVPKKPGQLTAFEASDPKLMAKIANPEIPLMVSKNHFKNWIDAVRANDPTKTVTSAEHGHRSTSVCSLGHMCMKTGKALKWDAKKECSDNAEANKLMKPFERGEFNLAVTLRRYGYDIKDFIK